MIFQMLMKICTAHFQFWLASLNKWTLQQRREGQRIPSPFYLPEPGAVGLKEQAHKRYPHKYNRGALAGLH